MNISLPLDKMTSIDKLTMIETIWEDLCKNPESIPSPDWHAETLKAREKAIIEGDATFSSFDLVIDRIRTRIK